MDDTYTAEDARQDPIDVVTDTTKELSADEWSSQSGGPWPEIRSLENGDDGVTYSFRLYSEQRSEDPHADIQLIADYWKVWAWTSGLSMKMLPHPVFMPLVAPCSEQVFTPRLPVPKVIESARCHGAPPGNRLELKVTENERRQQREVIPGDGYFLEDGP